MKSVFSVVPVAFAFIAGLSLSAQVRDWHDLDLIHRHVIEAIQEMDRARAANHYDMEGHGVRAAEHLRAAEHELDLAMRSVRAH